MITDAAVRRLNGYYGGRVRDEAYLELAQEHFLDWMHTEGFIRGQQVVFKGGTSLRKFVFGHRGRFSVDLDFSVAERTYGEYILEAPAVGFAPGRRISRLRAHRPRSHEDGMASVLTCTRRVTVTVSPRFFHARLAVATNDPN